MTSLKVTDERATLDSIIKTQNTFCFLNKRKKYNEVKLKHKKKKTHQYGRMTELLSLDVLEAIIIIILI